MFGTYIKPGSECCSAKNQAILEAEKLCKSGRTTGYTEIGDKIIGSIQPPHFMVPPSYELKAPFVTVYASRYSCENCGGSGTVVAESEAPLRCGKCKQIEQTMCEALWFRRCLCIQQEMAKRFAGDGDSGSVIFQKIEKITPPRGKKSYPQRSWPSLWYTRASISSLHYGITIASCSRSFEQRSPKWQRFKTGFRVLSNALDFEFHACSDCYSKFSEMFMPKFAIYLASKC